MVAMIRDAEPADVAAITEIYNEAIREGGLTGQVSRCGLRIAVHGSQPIAGAHTSIAAEALPCVN
jgi:hypothetical protein